MECADTLLPHFLCVLISHGYQIFSEAHSLRATCWLCDGSVCSWQRAAVPALRQLKPHGMKPDGPKHAIALATLVECQNRQLHVTPDIVENTILDEDYNES